MKTKPLTNQTSQRLVCALPLGIVWLLLITSSPAHAADAAGSALQPAPSKTPPSEVAARTVADTAGLPSLGIPPREAQTPKHLIDLSAFYNAGFVGNWVDNVADNDLSELPVGIQELAGTRFDVRGLIQLQGNKADPSRFPDRVTGLPAPGKCRRVHFLNGTMWTNSGRTNEIAKFIFHFADGTTLERPVVVRKDVLDWWAKPSNWAHDDGLVVAWSGQNRMTRGVGGGQTIQIYKTTWENPKPNVEITCIDFVSTKRAADPFLIAITTE